MVRVTRVSARRNPCQGGLSHSFLLDVEYRIGAETSRESWFVKVPITLASVAMDERELVTYNKIFPALQVYFACANKVTIWRLFKGVPERGALRRPGGGPPYPDYLRLQL